MKKFEDQPINLKIRLAALWTTVMFLYVYGDYFKFYTPNDVQDFLSGDKNLDSPASLFAASVLMAVPSLMIFFSVGLAARWARLLNLIFGSFYSALMILIGITSFGRWFEFYAFYAALEAFLTAYIVWLAWKWPAENIV